jgi:hypothetical protein
VKTELPEAHPTKWTVLSYGSVWARYATRLEAEATARALNAGKPRPTAFVQPPLAARAGKD